MPYDLIPKVVMMSVPSHGTGDPKGSWSVGFEISHSSGI